MKLQQIQQFPVMPIDHNDYGIFREPLTPIVIKKEEKEEEKED